MRAEGAKLPLQMESDKGTQGKSSVIVRVQNWVKQLHLCASLLAQSLLWRAPG
jgi:hypothetical protein